MHSKSLIILLPNSLNNYKINFSGLNILEIIEALRTSDHEDLEVQCEVFAESKQSDDEAIAQDFGVPDGTDHKALFGIIYEKV